MPWIVDSNGDDKYVASIYIKEELPTWNEVYNEWYKNKFYTYSKDTDQTLDTYWKIPKQKYLLSVICNQFNKMIFEDDSFDKNSIKSEKIGFKLSDNEYDIVYVGFDLNQTLGDRIKQRKLIAPPIYTFTNPNGNDLLFKSSHERIDVSDMNDMELNVYILMHIGDDYILESSINNTQTLDFVVDKLIQPFKNYFENGVGWKDEDGLLIKTNKPTFNRNNDPAL